MKKLLLSTLVICMALFVSCKKDSTSTSGGGGTTANKRISQIYVNGDIRLYVSSDEGNTWELLDSLLINELYESYNWDNDKIVSIDYNDANYRFVFNYNSSGMVSNINYCYDDIEFEKCVFSYNGSLINEINAYSSYEYSNDSLVLYATCNIEYSNGKPVRLSYTLYDDMYSNNKTDKGLRKYQKNRHNSIFDLYHNGITSKDGESPYRVVLTWDGKNITKIESVSGNEHNVETFTYDNHRNPFCGGNSLTAFALSYGSLTNLSANNALSDNCSYSYFEDYLSELSYTNEYISYYDDAMYKEIDSITYSLVYLTE